MTNSSSDSLVSSTVTGEERRETVGVCTIRSIDDDVIMKMISIDSL